MKGHLFHYSGNDEDGWPYRANGAWDHYALLTAFECCNVLTLDASPWCDVPEATEKLRWVRAMHQGVRVLAVIRGPNGWDGPVQRTQQAWGDPGWYWWSLCNLRDAYPMPRRPEPSAFAPINIDMRRALPEFNGLLERVVASGVFDGIFLDQWYLYARAFGFDVDDAEWSLAMDMARAPVLFVNTGERRTTHAQGQMFENWPNLPQHAGGWPGIASLVQPGDVLSIQANQVYSPNEPPKSDTRARALTVYSDALRLGCYAAVASSPISPKTGRQWDALRGHAPWRFR